MPREIVVDFTDAPPAQGGAGSDYIPQGKYLWEIKSAEKTSAKSSGAEMIVVELAVVQGVDGTAYAGKKNIDRFTFPRNAEASKFGLQRFHALMVAVGYPPQSGKVKIDLDKLVGRRVIGDVEDEHQAAQGEYGARTVSRIRSYSSAKTPAAAKPAAETAPATEPEPEPEPEPVAVTAADDGDLTEVASAVDDLFD